MPLGTLLDPVLDMPFAGLCMYCTLGGLAVFLAIPLVRFPMFSPYCFACRSATIAFITQHVGLSDGCWWMVTLPPSELHVAGSLGGDYPILIGGLCESNVAFLISPIIRLSSSSHMLAEKPHPPSCRRNPGSKRRSPLHASPRVSRSTSWVSGAAASRREGVIAQREWSAGDGIGAKAATQAMGCTRLTVPVPPTANSMHPADSK
jgi:hypothetical protein